MAVELLLSELWDRGCTGLFESGENSTGDVEIVAGFETRPEAEAIAKDFRSHSAVSADSITVEPAPTAAQWAGEDEPATVVATGAGSSGELMIRAGGAFGHGAHPTTRLALDLLVAPSASAERVLDVGTGTGVLAIAAAKAGAGEVWAIDNDPHALEMAKENAIRNDVQIDCSSATIGELFDGTDGPGFDLVLINVLLPVHRQLAVAVIRAIKPGGSLIAAGYLTEQADELLALYRSVLMDSVGPGVKAGRTMTILGQATAQDWSAHHLRPS